MKKYFLVFITFCFSTFLFAASGTHISTQSHQAAVTAILPSNSKNVLDYSYFTAGDDGFVVKWSDDNQGEHYQFSDVGIKMLAISPNGNDIAIYESDGGSVNKISVWDWRTQSRKFVRKYSDSITSLSFSAKGTYLMIGTASVNGIEFFSTQSWTKTSKIKNVTNIVNFIQTSSTEKSCVVYSPSGYLSYYDMATGQIKGNKFTIPQGLSQIRLFNNNIFLAGVKDNLIYIINAYKGTTVSTINAQNPILLSNSSDNNLYYVEYDGKNNYELKMLESIANKLTEDGPVSHTISNPRNVKTLKGPRGLNAICTGLKDYSEVILGSKSGAVYKFDTDPSITTQNMSEITENTYAKILDMTSAPNDFYFLTENSIFSSSLDSGIVDKKASNNGQNNIINYSGNEVILWTKSSRKSVDLLNLTDKSIRTLFTPKSTLITLRKSSIKDKNYLIAIESNTTVYLYNFETNTLNEIYSGSGIQDAILADDGYLYISKSAATNPQVPLISVNIETYETVPLSLKGNVAYGLSTNGTVIYGIVLQSDDNVQNTYVFQYNTVQKTAGNVLKFGEEDSEAFTYLYGNSLYTNIGKNKVYCYNMGTKKRFSYTRSASIPKSVCQSGNRVVILNNNGSISWCGTQNNVLIADWYLTTDEQWYEF